jgi:aminotransferase
MRTLLCNGDEVIVPEPCFVGHKACVTMAGGTPVIVPLKAENSFKLTAEQLEKAVTPRTKLLILQYPNNPTGAIMTKADLDPIVQYLKDKDIIVISDEIYSELCYNGKHISIASYPEMYDKTIVINGFSKAFAMTGWRLGYACGPKEIIGVMTKIHQYAIMSAPTTAQYAAIEAMQNCDGAVAGMRNEYNLRRRIMVDGFRKAGLSCFEPEGAFYVFPDIRATGLNSEAFADNLLMKKQVLVIPGCVFGDCGEGFVRATYANSMENIIEAMKRIQQFVKELIN